MRAAPLRFHNPGLPGSGTQGGDRCASLQAVSASRSQQSWPSSADRCTQNANGWSCTHTKRYNYYWCGGYYVPWAVPATVAAMGRSHSLI